MIPDELKEMTVPTRQDKNKQDGLGESYPMPTRQDDK
jgi:hypothetical protein